MFHFAGLPDELEGEALAELDGFAWQTHVYPGGNAQGPPPYLLSIDPQLPDAGTFSTSGPTMSYRAMAYQSGQNGQPPIDSWPAAMELDLDARTVQIAARIPGVGEATAVRLGAHRFETLGQAPTESEELSPFRVTPREFALGDDLPSLPQAIEPEAMPDGSTAYDLSDRGIPARIIAPPGWSLQTHALDFGAAGVAPPDTNPSEIFEMGVSLRDLTGIPDLGSAADVIERIVSETDGAYEPVADAPPFDLPPGFEATTLLRTVRGFQIGAEPGRVLTNWTGVEGSTIRLVVGMAGDRAVVGYLEALDWPRAEEILPYLAQMEIVAD